MSRPNLQSGLPTADDYDPEAIGTANISAGDPEQTYEEYGLELVPILHDDEDIGQRLIRRNGEYLATVSSDYQLLPNEVAVQAANEVAQDLDAVPFHMFDGDWFVKLDDHVFQDPERRRVHAVYAWDSRTIGTDKMEYGFAVHNSIDGSMAFRVGLFSFRHACANMVMIGTGGRAEGSALSVESERDVLAESSHRHTKGLGVDTESLRERIQATLIHVDTVHDTYRQWVERTLDAKEVYNLIDHLPSKDLPEWIADIEETFKDIVEEEDDLDSYDELPWNDRAEIITAELQQAESAWKTYNGITENLWKRGTSNDQTRHNKFKKLHRVLNPGGSRGVNLR